MRQGGFHDTTASTSGTPPASLAHHSDRLLIQLNSGWRVVDDDLQYILQRAKGAARSKATGWVGRAFCRRRESLLRRIKELCSEVGEDALNQLLALPERHADRM